MTPRLRRAGRPAPDPAPHLSATAAEDIRVVLPGVAEDVVAAIIEEVPSYTDAFSGPMGETIRNAVQVALGGFLSLATERSARGSDTTPTAAAVDGAYQLGRGEARSGRSTDALLSAYRIGARVAWRQMSARGVAAGLEPDTLAWFAGLVFAYIDELSAASVAGHSDELATTGRVRQRMLERVAHHLLVGSPPETVLAAAERAEWSPPTTLTAVVLPASQVRPVLARVSAQTLQAEAPDVDDAALLLVPDAHGPERRRLLRAVERRGAHAGPARPWLEVSGSVARAQRARALGLPTDTEEHLTELVVTADPEALADLRARTLEPLAGLRPATVERLSETLREWLLRQGRREEVAAALFVHPQTVRYRMTQLREAYGDRLDDPAFVRAAVIALAPRRVSA